MSDSYPARLRLWAAAKPDAVALRDSGGPVTWAALDLTSDAIARNLAARGVREDDIVTIALASPAAVFAVAWGVWKLGATPQSVSIHLSSAELAALLTLGKAKLYVGAAAEPLPTPAATYEELTQAGGVDVPVPDRTSRIWKAASSGGSTGAPKIILSGEPALFRQTRANFYGIGSGDTMLMTAPPSHNAGFSLPTLATTSGASVVFGGRFDAEETLKTIEVQRITWLYLVPTMMSRILRLPDAVRARYDLSSLKRVWHMAAPCPTWVKEAWIAWLGPDRIWEIYAGTEGQAYTVISGAEWLAHRGSVGRVAIGEMKIVRDDGLDAAPGESGEIYMRPAPGSPPTYRYVGATARTLGEGWQSLGDIGRFDAEGYLYLLDRRTDMILVGGANVYPAEVEAVLERHPEVLSSAVIGLPDDDLGARIHAIVEAPPALDLEALKQLINESLVPYTRPRSIEIVDAPLRDQAGKVQRFKLRAARLSSG